MECRCFASEIAKGVDSAVTSILYGSNTKSSVLHKMKKKRIYKSLVMILKEAEYVGYKFTSIT
jgi:hypothetical protein